MQVFKFTYTGYYLLAIVIIAFVALLGHAGIQFMTDAQRQQEPAITVSNQQRILSQRLAFYCLYLVGDSPDKINDDIRETIKLLKRQMLHQHLGLQHGDTSLELSALNDEEVQMLFDKAPNRLNDKISQYFAAIDNLLSTPDSELRWDHPSLVLIADDAEDGYLLSSLDKITLGFKAQQKKHMIFQQKVQWSVFACILVALGAVARFIFYPMLVAIEKKEQLLKERNKKLLIMCKRMVKPVRKQRRKEEKEKKAQPLLLAQPKRKRLYYTSVPDFED